MNNLNYTHIVLLFGRTTDRPPHPRNKAQVEGVVIVSLVAYELE
jgi:hypothetical protein